MNKTAGKLVKYVMLMLGLFVALCILNGNEVKAAPQKIDDDGYEISRSLCGDSAGAVHWYCYDAPNGKRATIGVKLVIKPESGNRMLDYKKDEQSYYYDDGSEHGVTRHYDYDTVCKSLQFVDVASGITYVGTNAFAGFGTLKKVRIPASVTSIGKNAVPAGAAYTIICVKGSVAETYAKNNGNTIVYMSGSQTSALATPTVSGISIKNGNVTVSWNKIAGATGYYVYHRIGNGAWTRIATTTALSYADKAVSSGYTYQYCVKAYNSKTVSGITASKQVKYLASPTATAANGNGYVSVKWNKIAGATGYYVYRRIGSGAWTRIATTRALGYADKAVKSGTIYQYCARAYSSGYASLFTASKQIKYLASPTATAANGNGYVSVKWNKIAGATGYYVYRRIGSGAWTRIATTRALGYADKAVKSGTIYQYCARAYNSSYASLFTASKQIKYLSSPVVSVAKGNGYISVKWTKPVGATGYYVYRKIGSGVWTRIATTTALGYADKAVKKGTTYQYCVRAYNSSHVSAYIASKQIKYS